MAHDLPPASATTGHRSAGGPPDTPPSPSSDPAAAAPEPGGDVPPQPLAPDAAGASVLEPSPAGPAEAPRSGPPSAAASAPPPSPHASSAPVPATSAAAGPLPGAPGFMINMPIDVRNMSLALLALFATVALLHWASAVFIPLMLSVLLTTALHPAVSALHRWHIPRWLGAGVLLMGIVGSLGGAAWSLSDGAAELVDSVPVAARKVRDAMRQRMGGPSPLDTMQKAATQIEQAATESIPPQTRRGVQRVVIERAPFNIRDYVWSGTMGLASAAGQITVVVFLTFFALASGNLFRRKLMRIAGHSLERRKVTMAVLDDITGQIQRYLLVQLLTSVLVGVATGAAYALLGLENPAVWGVVAGVLNLAPYIGSVVVTGASALVAFLQFGTVDMALAIGGASLFIHTLVGNLLTPWLTSKTSRMSPVAVFVSVLVWGWLWGLWGLLLGIPVMMAVKAICDRVEDLRAVGELLGD
ncbi:AI-2E family transporter [Acidovorax sp. NCPPB 3576]|uniref:AI-2E family transporter n=1 Tax=Acidovorax sp. NCPPB 3576 TaxID=2940488 RepID=UPI00234901B8|nr:AI-2E family transporter [Acidovorax sp. NCPPB 3576]WCM90908.1 AI-2E family transporter [Acidovorax sp. NCPPB 3576]